MKTADLRRALDPRRSAVVAACAGSGKTWLLTARVLRLLVEGASPGSILAFTYTRAAAAEISRRVAEGAQRLARADDSDLRALLAELQIESPAAETLAAARKIHRRLLLAQPGLEISTMHGWFLELIKSRPWEEGRVGPPRLRVGGDAALIRRLAWRDFCAAPPPEVGEIFAAGFETESLREWMFSFLSRRVARRIMDDWSRREGGAPSIPESIVDWRLAARAFLRAAPPTGGKEFTIRRAQIEAALAENNPTVAWAAVFTAAGTPRKDLEKPATQLHALAESLRARAAARLSPAATAAGDYSRVYTSGAKRRAARSITTTSNISLGGRWFSIRSRWRLSAKWIAAAVIWSSTSFKTRIRRNGRLCVAGCTIVTAASARRRFSWWETKSRRFTVFAAATAACSIAPPIFCAIITAPRKSPKTQAAVARLCCCGLLIACFCARRKRALLILKTAIPRLILKAAIRLIPKTAIRLIPKTTISRRIARIRKTALCPRGLFVIRY